MEKNMQEGNPWWDNLNSQPGGCPDPAVPNTQDMSGFSEAEMTDLEWMKQQYASGWTVEQQEVLAEQRRLEFIRWLVRTGKLTDQLTDQL